MTSGLSPFDPRDPPHQRLNRRLLDHYLSRVPPRISGPELNRQLDQAWRAHQRTAAARRALAQDALDRRLEIEAVDLYTQLGKAVGGLTTQESWVALAEEVDAFEDAERLSSRHAQDLRDRLVRAAEARGWVRA